MKVPGKVPTGTLRSRPAQKSPAGSSKTAVHSSTREANLTPLVCPDVSDLTLKPARPVHPSVPHQVSHGREGLPLTSSTAQLRAGVWKYRQS